MVQSCLKLLHKINTCIDKCLFLRMAINKMDCNYYCSSCFLVSWENHLKLILFVLPVRIYLMYSSYM